MGDDRKRFGKIEHYMVGLLDEQANLKNAFADFKTEIKAEVNSVRLDITQGFSSMM